VTALVVDHAAKDVPNLRADAVHGGYPAGGKSGALESDYVVDGEPTGWISPLSHATATPGPALRRQSGVALPCAGIGSGYATRLRALERRSRQ
jgi:hypothetical protein